MMGRIKQTLRRTFPSAYRRADEARAQAAFRRLDVLVKDFTSRKGAIVQGGPFAGMTLAQEALSGISMPKLLGSYEAELHDLILELRDYERIINIGCAEGYYAVGLARRMPGATVYAFDILENERRHCQQAARANGVEDQMVIGGNCGIEQLNSLVTARTLIVIDCEGCEYELLQPEKVPSLKHCDILVELHAVDSARVPAALLDRFRTSHETRMFRYGSHKRQGFEPVGLPSRDQQIAIHEFRDMGLDWAFLKARPSNA